MKIMSDAEAFGWKISTVILCIVLGIVIFKFSSSEEIGLPIEIQYDTITINDTVLIHDTIIKWYTKPTVDETIEDSYDVVDF